MTVISIGDSRLVEAPGWGSPRLVGRDAETGLIRSFLGQVATQGGVLQLSGNPGIGKSALVDVAVAAASSSRMRVVRLLGTPSEADVRFSGLQRLLLALENDLAVLGPAQRDCLLHAVTPAKTQKGPEDVAPVSLALLELLRRLSRTSPILVAIDDLQWMDRPTRGVLSFVAHRLARGTLGILSAFRPSLQLEMDGQWPVLELASLDRASSAELLDLHHPDIHPRVRRQVLAEANGNPLGLIELPRALSKTQLAGAAYLPSPLPLSRRLRASLRPELLSLGPTAKRLVLLAALEGTGDLQVLQSAAQDAAGLECLAPAQRAGLIEIGAGDRYLTFRDPLLLAAIVDMASNEERRQAHVQLADLLRDQPERWPWHLAEAALEPDDELAAFLEASARRMLANGAVTDGITTLLRAARLSARAQDRGRRLARAANVGAHQTGDWQIAYELLVDAQRSHPGAAGSLEAAVTMSWLILNSDGDVDSAHRKLVTAIEAAIRDERTENEALLEALRALGYICALGGQPQLWRLYEAAAQSLPAEATQELQLYVRCYADPLRADQSDLSLLEQRVGALDDQLDPREVVRISAPALHLDRLAGCRPALWRVVESGRQGDAIGSAVEAMTLLSVDAFHTGRWEEADTLASEALAFCRSHDFQSPAWLGWYSRGLVAAVQGRHDAAKELANEIARWALPHGARSVRHYASVVRVLSSLGQGDFEMAYQQASMISRSGQLDPYTPPAIWVMMDMVEAATRTGRVEQARAHVAAIKEARIDKLSSRFALLAGASAALVAPAGAAEEIFDRAMSIGGLERWPFDVARVHLLYGEYLRRIRSTTRARHYLNLAVETFDYLGAQPWLKRAGQELRAAGLGQLHANEQTSVVLTAQELEIAKLAGSGLTNREIGQRLYLSHRTVGTHLYRVFPKLGITTRAALRDALSDAIVESCA